MAETDSAERLIALETEYAHIMAQVATTRTQRLSDRLTRSRKQAQMREATIEEAEDQAAYFEGRTREMEGIVHMDEANLSALTARATGVYGQIAEIRVCDALAAFDAIMSGLTPQIDALAAALTKAAPYLQTAFALRNALPDAATDTRAALADATDRADKAEVRLRELRHQSGLKSTENSSVR